MRSTFSVPFYYLRGGFHWFSAGCYDSRPHSWSSGGTIGSRDFSFVFCRRQSTLLSSQIINLEKPTMTFSPGTSDKARGAIQNILGIQVVPKFEKYLGMPAVVGRLKKDLFSFLKDRVWGQIKRWNERDFFMAGREVLIKAVLQAIPTYVMSCFLLPCSILQDIEKLVRQFWWSGGDSRSMHWLSWA